MAYIPLTSHPTPGNASLDDRLGTLKPDLATVLFVDFKYAEKIGLRRDRRNRAIQEKKIKSPYALRNDVSHPTIVCQPL